MKYPKTFESVKIGPKAARNRLMRLPTTPMLAEAGRIGNQMLAFYDEVARGGVGTIVSESFTVRPVGTSAPGSIMMSNGAGPVVATDPNNLPGLRKLTETVHAAGALMIGQVYHSGRQHLGRLVPTMIAPSAIACPHSGGIPHEMTIEEVEAMIDAFVLGARYCIEAGMDGIEIHGAQGHLVQQFVSPFSNRRRDRYGGSLEDRLRFPREIMARIRKHWGNDIIVGYRMGASELHDGGITVEESEQAVRIFVNEGLLDYISLSQGNFSTNDVHIPDRHYPPMTYRDMHRRIKQAAGAMLIATCGRIEGPEEAEELISDGTADLVALCRSLIADPAWPKKALEQKAQLIRKCIVCNKCWDLISDGRPIRCSINAAAGREYVLGPLSYTKQRKHILVIGGGPAGMEASRIAASRGHRVTLLERQKELGGKLTNASRSSYHAELARVSDYLVRQLSETGVNVLTNVEADIALIKQHDPDAIILATGSSILVPDLAGDGSVPVRSFDGSPLPDPVDRKVIVVMDEDGYAWGASAAETALKTGKQIVVISRSFEIFRELPSVTRIATLRNLDNGGAQLMPNSVAVSVDRQAVIVRNVWSGSEHRIENVAAMLWVGMQQANDDLAHTLRAEGYPNFHVVGDAYSPRRLLFAIEEGNAAGRAA